MVADAFCHSMVRSLVGVVVPVGEGRRPVSWPLSILGAGRRDASVVVMPPHGLSLEEVAYPPDAELAERALQTRARRAVPPDAVPGTPYPSGPEGRGGQPGAARLLTAAARRAPYRARS